MAAVPITVTSLNQKIARNTQVAAQEDTWTVTGPGTAGIMWVLWIRPSQATFYHSTAGSTASDGLVIAANQAFPIRLSSNVTAFSVRPVSTAGTIDCWVSEENMPVPASPGINTDPNGSLTQGNSTKPTYHINTLASAPTAANYTILNVESGATKTTRIRRIIISNVGAGTAGALLTFELIRTTAASSVGTAVTPALSDTSTLAADAAFSGIARKDGPTITAGTQITTFALFQPATNPAAMSPFVLEFYGQMAKSLVIPVGTANGIALRCINGNAGAANFCASIEFTEETL